MNRRTYLTATATVGSTVLAGCSAALNRFSGPEYEDVSKEDMLLSASDFPEGWRRNDSLNDNFDAAFQDSDGTVFVLLSVSLFDEVSAAEDGFEDARSGFRDPQDIDIGDEAFWDTRNDEFAFTIFRHSNANGSSVSIRQSGLEVVPDQNRSQNYAGKMFQHWQQDL
jgi:hypothetical protein